MILFTGNANPTLAHKIAQNLNIPLGKAVVTQFRDKESKIEIHEEIAGKEIFIVQSTSTPANHHWMELFLMVNALNQSGAKSIVVVMPYFGYARQNHPIHFDSAPLAPKMLAELLAAVKIDAIMAVDLHNETIPEYFSMPVLHIDHSMIFLKNIVENSHLDDIIVSPDMGGTMRANNIAKHFKNTKPIIMNKCRLRQHPTSEVEIVNLLNDVDVINRNCIIVDDIIDSGNTICAAALALKKRGAKKISAYITHAVLSKGALTNIRDSCLNELIISDTINLEENYFKEISNESSILTRTISIAPLLAKSIKQYSLHKN